MRSSHRLVLTLAALAVVASGCSIARPTVEESSTDPQPSPPISDVLTLESSGVGPFTVGSEATAVIAGMAEVIGGWDVDSTLEVTTVQLPDCGVVVPRVVSWGSLALVFMPDAVGEVFTSWSYGFDPLTGDSKDLRQLGLETARGIGLGSTRSELVSAYGTNVAITDLRTIDSAVFTVQGNGISRLTGKLDAAGSSGVVDLIQIEPTC